MQNNASPSFPSQFQTMANQMVSPMIFSEFDSAPIWFEKAIDRHFQYRSSLMAVQDRQEMINRHSLCLTRLRQAADEATSLRRENNSLRSLNAEMIEKLRLLIHASLTQNRLGPRTAFGSEKMGGIETVGVERFSLPKSISIKSDEYLKKPRGFGGNGGRTRSSTRPRTDALQNVKQKVYARRAKRQEEEEEEAVVEIEVKKQGSVKTELCNKWQESGECPYGSQCQFAHGVAELRPVIRHPRYKTQLCRMVLAGAACPYGHRCHFLHTVDPRQVNTS